MFSNYIIDTGIDSPNVNVRFGNYQSFTALVAENSTVTVSMINGDQTGPGPGGLKISVKYRILEI